MRTSKASSPYERTKWVSKYFTFLYISLEFWSKIYRLEAVTNEQYAKKDIWLKMKKVSNINVPSLEKPIQLSA